jgi:serine/threonine protein kinase
MALLSGTRIGPYEVLSLLGSGGMGEVYRARDARLHRDVALKLLPATVAADPDRLARFTREAQVLAALNHPNIGAIYGIEESEGITALVLELVEGPTLAERIVQGPIPLDDALTTARQMADALEFAHEQGIIHRDLKPANVKLRPDGTVKVLDFGLAKAVGSPGTTSGVMADATQSPTFSAHATEAGIILGTAAYMSPEQARGRVVDRRADIWAFGAVLFETLAGARPFAGETISDTLAAIIKDAPPWDALPATILPEIRALLQRTLEKDPRRRLRDIGDARLALEDAQSGASRPTPPPSLAGTSNRLRPWWRTVLPWAIAVAALATMAWRRPVDPGTSGLPLLKYTLEIPGLSLERYYLPALSPDGHALAFVKDHGLWVRGIDQLEARQIAGASDPQNLFWSPDSRQIAYVSGGALWRAPLEGGPPVRVAPFRFSRGGRTPGGVWCADGQIVFALSATGTGFLAVSSQGGEFTDFYQRNAATEGDFHRPSLLPDGRSLLFVVDRVDSGADTIGILSGSTRKDVLTIKGEILDSAAYSPSGHIVFHRETTAPGVWAVPFSLDRLAVTGEPFIVAPQGSWPSMGTNGLLLYANDQLSGLEQLVWFDIRAGRSCRRSASSFDRSIIPPSHRTAARWLAWRTT